MTWFRVDDTFYSHKKVAMIPRDVRAAAIGTWTLCGTWSAGHETDGAIPAYIIDEVGGTEAGAKALVKVRLWRFKNGVYQFNNWAEYQFTRQELISRRAKERDRKAAYRSTPRENTGNETGNVPQGQNRRPTPPVPSRPVPLTTDDKDSAGRPTLSSDSDRTTELSTGVSPLVESVVEAVGRQGLTIHPLVVPSVIEFIEARRGPRATPVRLPGRYYAKTIAGDTWPEIEKFIHSEGLAS